MKIKLSFLAILFTSVIFAQLPNNYVAFYEFTNGSSVNSVAPAYSQQELKNLVSSNFIQDRHGQARSAYRFSKNNASSGGYYYSAPSSVPIIGFTTSFWYKSTTSAPSADEIMMQCFQNRIPQPGWRISRTSSNALSFRISYNNSRTDPRRHKTFDLSNSSVFDGGWHHIVLTIRSVQSASGFTTSTAGIYIDGVKNITGSRNLSGYGNPFWNHGARFVITPTNQFNGALDDILLYKRGITGSEARAIYLNQVCSSVVNIPDANFKNALLDHGVGIKGSGETVIDTNGDGEICISEAQNYKGLIHVYNKNISDLTGIEAFTSLKYLWCGNNSLTSVDVSNNTALISLSLSNNSLTSIDVSQNRALTEFSCYNNQPLTSLNLANGNNGQFKSIEVENNPNLVCIQHDSGFTPPAWNPNISEGWKKDNTASWSDNCTSASTNDVAFNSAVTLYPNPVSSKLYINAEKANISSVKIYNILGKEVTSATQKQVEVSNLPSGVYILKVLSSEGKVATKKFIKQ